jgi:hypothetical protein
LKYNDFVLLARYLQSIISRQSALTFTEFDNMSTNYNVIESAAHVVSFAELAGDTSRDAASVKANLGDTLLSEAAAAFAVDGYTTSAQLLVAVARQLDCTFSAACGDGMELKTTGKKPKEMTEGHKARVGAFRSFAQYINKAVEFELPLDAYDSMTELRAAIKKAQPDDEMSGLRDTIKEAQKVIADNWSRCSTERRQLIREAIIEAAQLSVISIDDII